MLALQIADNKYFMNKLFLQKTFDAFWLSEASFTTFSTFHIDGTFQKAYYSTQELEEQNLAQQAFAPWRQIRPFALSLIRGRHTPLEFRIILRLPPANTERLLAQAHLSLRTEDIDGLFLNLRYRDGRATCTTGVSWRFFTLDKSLEYAWDDLVQKFFQKEAIAVENSSFC